MKRSTKLLTAILGVAALCLCSFEVASAVTSKPDSLSATEAIAACATEHGNLRLPNGSGHCTDSTSKVHLARSASAPKALAIDITSGSKGQTLSLIDNTKLKTSCLANTGGDVAGLSIAHSGKTQVDGTSYLVTGGTGSVDFIYADGGSNPTPGGASSVYSTNGGGFDAVAGNGYATLNAHLLVTIPGAVFTIDTIIDVNKPQGYCRISAEVESAATP